MNLPTISLVTCSYQQARFLEPAIRSVLDQRYPGLEYLVMDGGSTDGSVDIIRRHADQLAYWVSGKDGGQTDALATGFERCTGDICGWLCSDDLLLPGALDSVARYFAAHPEVDALYGDALWIDDRGRLLRPKAEPGFDAFVLHYDHNYLPQPSTFWRRSLYEKVGGLNRGLNLTMDGDLWARFAAHGRIAHMRRYLSCMRYYTTQKTRALRPDALREGRFLRERYENRTGVVWPVTLAYVIAKARRMLAKGVAGCYWAKVPDPLVRALERYEIEQVHELPATAPAMPLTALERSEA